MPLLRWLRWAALPALAIPALWPYTQGWPATADGWLHLVRLTVLDQHVQRGVLYPRWVPELVLGYGYPVFNFYGPTTYFLAELLQACGAGYYLSLMGTFGVLVVLGGGGMYLWARDVLDQAPQPWAALVAAAAYMYAPYLLTNVYIRAAIGEVGAQALLPWIFWSFRRLLRGPQPARYVLPAVLSLGGLAATHNITLLLLPPALLGYLAVVWWTGGRTRQALLWAAAGGLGAVGVSAFFWLPLIGERQYLAATAFDIARQVLPAHAWTWRNFLNPALAFSYPTDGPFQLGLVQIVLAAAGFAGARRRDAEWQYLIVLAVLAGLGISVWSVPLWLGSEVGLIVQFPWRLLSLLGLSLSVVTGYLVYAGLPKHWWAAIAAAWIVLIICAQHPRLPASSLTRTDDEALDLAAAAQFESQTGALGTSSAREFFPRWVEQMEPAREDADSGDAAQTVVTLTKASPYERVLTVTAPTATTLRFSEFYYPNWQAELDGDTRLELHASTAMGLLAADLPAGTHQVRLRLQDTPLQRLANLVTMAALAGLMAFCASQRGHRQTAVVPALLLAAVGLATLLPKPPAAPISAAALPLGSFGVRLLGFRLEQSRPGYVELQAYWHTTARPPRLEARWQLLAPDGGVVSEILSEPYYNTRRTDQWTAGMVVDDAYRMALPPGLPAGEYGLALSLQRYGQAATTAPGRIGSVQLEAVPATERPAPARPSKVSFGGQITFAGYDLERNGRAVEATDGPVVVRFGDLLEYELYWQASAPIRSNFHSLLHFVGADQTSLIQKDQVAGSWFRAPMLWDAFSLQPETYRVQIPHGAAGGVYWPHLGLYDFESLARLPVAANAEQVLGDTLSLLPIKLVSEISGAPRSVIGRFEAVAVLLAFDLELPPGGARPGDNLNLTLYFWSQDPGGHDYTRFVHLHSAALGMAAQADGPPQRGLNPTWSWVLGEVVTDQVSLTIGSGAQPGLYDLRVGFYDPAAEDARLAVYDARNALQPDASLVLMQVQLLP